MPDFERRSGQLEVRAKGRKLEGYAATFGTEARIHDYTETIAPGAFRSTLAEGKDVLALVDHDPARVLGRTKTNTLRLSEDSRGLHFDVELPNTTFASDVLALAERGDLGGASFAFNVRDEEWQGDHRELRSVDLHEISIVSAWPAYEGTLVQARARPATHGHLRGALARRFLDSIT